MDAPGILRDSLVLSHALPCQMIATAVWPQVFRPRHRQRDQADPLLKIVAVPPARPYGIAGRARRWGSICRSEYPDGGRILRSPNGQKKPIDLRHPKRRPRTCRGCKMRHSDEVIRLRGEYIQKPLAATDVYQTTLCIHEQVIGVAASLNGMRHSAVAKVEGGKLRRMPKHDHDLLTLGIDREREVGA